MVNESELKSWIVDVRNSASKLDLVDIADEYIGHVLAHAPVNPTEGFWPPSPVCKVIEEFGASEIETGICIECYNKRGVVTKAIHEGGAQERILASDYERWATETISVPRTSAMLLKIAESWTNRAKQADIRAELGKMKR